MAGAGEIRVKGAKELERAFMQLRREVLREIKPALLEIADVVAKDAEERARTRISGLYVESYARSAPWARMRIGVTTKAVYVAPREHGRRGSGKRPNLAGLLMDKAMQPALDAHADEAMAKLDTLVNVSAARAGF